MHDPEVVRDEQRLRRLRTNEGHFVESQMVVSGEFAV
jgi:hypothetical protein